MFSQIFPHKRTVIGMIHLPPLLGYKKHPGLKAMVKHALKDLGALEKGGVGGVIVENEFDHPHQVTVGPEIVAAMTRIVSEVVKHASVAVGVEVLLNDPKASLAIAKVCGADFIRTDYFVDRMSRSEYGGKMYINPVELMAYRKKIGAEKIAILADVQVKYAKLLEKGKKISTSVNQAFFSGADGVVVSGRSGLAPKIADVEEVVSAAKGEPIVIGSGVSMENAKELLDFADAIIIGRRFKNRWNYMSYKKISKLMNLCLK